MVGIPPCISCFVGDRNLGRVRTGVVGARRRGCEAIGYIYIYTTDRLKLLVQIRFKHSALRPGVPIRGQAAVGGRAGAPRAGVAFLPPVLRDGLQTLTECLCRSRRLLRPVGSSVATSRPTLSGNACLGKCARCDQCQYINEHHDVDGLCRKLPERLQKLVDAKGDRIKP